MAGLPWFHPAKSPDEANDEQASQFISPEAHLGAHRLEGIYVATMRSTQLLTKSISEDLVTGGSLMKAVRFCADGDNLNTYQARGRTGHCIHTSWKFVMSRAHMHQQVRDLTFDRIRLRLIQ